MTEEWDNAQARRDRGHRTRETLGTWLVVGNAGGLVLLYNAALQGRVELQWPASGIGLLFAVGAAVAFAAKYLAAPWLNWRPGDAQMMIVRAMVILAAVCLIAGMVTPLFVDLVRPEPTVAG